MPLTNHRETRPLVLDLLKEQERRRVQREEKSRTPPPINGYRNSVGQASPKKRKRSPLTEDEDDVVEITASELQQSNISGVWFFDAKHSKFELKACMYRQG